jgi:anti-sigma regulatory factor (Ser/Thr protein kinase)
VNVGLRTWRVQRDLSHVGVVRREVSRTVAEWWPNLAQETLDDLELCVSELVANAVVHGGTECVVTLASVSDRIRVEVVDGCLDEPRVNPDPTDTGGRGLALVASLSARWNWYPAGAGKVVWFELPAPLACEGVQGLSLSA